MTYNDMFSFKAEHSIHFNDPVHLAKQISEKTGMPYFTEHLSLTEKHNNVYAPRGFNGWRLASFRENEKDFFNHEEYNMISFNCNDYFLHIGPHLFWGSFFGIIYHKWPAIIRSLMTLAEDDYELEDIRDEFYSFRRELFHYIKLFGGSNALYYNNDNDDIGKIIARAFMKKMSFDEVISEASDKGIEIITLKNLKKRDHSDKEKCDALILDHI